MFPGGKPSKVPELALKRRWKRKHSTRQRILTLAMRTTSPTSALRRANNRFRRLYVQPDLIRRWN